MTALSRALETLKASLGEVRATLDSRTAQIDGITAVSPIVMPHFGGLPQQRNKFDAALRSRSAPPDSLYRGLFVISVSAFERFVKMLISALVQLKSEVANRFSDLTDSFQRQYVVRAAQVLTNISSGTVKGIPYNFSSLQASVGLCFTNTGKPNLDGDVFTILMGNPTWDRLEDTLKSLGITDPFDQAFGSDAAVRGWGKASWKGNLTEAKSKLNALMDRRNLIVHAARPTSVVEQDIVDACDFFEAIARGLVDEMPRRLN